MLSETTAANVLCVEFEVEETTSSRELDCFCGWFYNLFTLSSSKQHPKQYSYTNNSNQSLSSCDNQNQARAQLKVSSFIFHADWAIMNQVNHALCLPPHEDNENKEEIKSRSSTSQFPYIDSCDSDDCPSLSATLIYDDTDSSVSGESLETLQAKAAILISQRDRHLDRLREKLEELKDVCMQESEITGEVPSEYPVSPNSTPPRPRKGAKFQLSDSLLTNSLDHSNQQSIGIDQSSFSLSSEQDSLETQKRNLVAEIELVSQILKAEKMMKKSRGLAIGGRSKQKERIAWNESKLKSLRKQVESLDAAIHIGDTNGHFIDSLSSRSCSSSTLPRSITSHSQFSAAGGVVSFDYRGLESNNIINESASSGTRSSRCSSHSPNSLGRRRPLPVEPVSVFSAGDCSEETSSEHRDSSVVGSSSVSTHSLPHNNPNGISNSSPHVAATSAGISALFYSKANGLRNGHMTTGSRRYNGGNNFSPNLSGNHHKSHEDLLGSTTGSSSTSTYNNNNSIWKQPYSKSGSQSSTSLATSLGGGIAPGISSSSNISKAEHQAALASGHGLSPPIRILPPRNLQDQGSSSYSYFSTLNHATTSDDSGTITGSVQKTWTRHQQHMGLGDEASFTAESFSDMSLQPASTFTANNYSTTRNQTQPHSTDSQQTYQL